MRLRIENEWLTDSRNLHEIEQVLSRWAGQHPDQAIYAYRWEGDLYYDDWVSFLNEMADSDAEITLVTKQEAELKEEMRESVLSYCENLKQHLPGVIENLFGIHPETEENKLAALFEGLNYLISSASLLNVDEAIEDRHESVVELAAAFESRDFVELADLLKYDWLPWVSEYEAALKKLHVRMS